ncbi:MAG: cobalt-precorrin 5A hydrolase [Clostridia bacterium]|nr:cobalt-precorrin 5A hydrolase [Clostridia bacterium]
MKTAVTALTKKGSELAVRIGKETSAKVFIKPEFIAKAQVLDNNPDIAAIDGNFTDFAGSLLENYDAVIFIMACGIVVRAIAPFIRSKAVDPAVVVMDEKGQYAISLLSGHLGGANALAETLAGITGGKPVITTATDVNGVLAFDLFAQQNDLAIENIDDLKHISSALVNGGIVGLYSELGITGELPENVKLLENLSEEAIKTVVAVSNRTLEFPQDSKILCLRPRNLILGLGCKRGTSKESIRRAVESFMQLNKISRRSIKCIATADIKKDEQGISDYCSEQGLELRIINREEIKKVEHIYSASDFVRSSTGVSSIAEPSAVLAGANARLICKKTAYNGITLALAEEEKELYI